MVYPIWNTRRASLACCSRLETFKGVREKDERQKNLHHGRKVVVYCQWSFNVKDIECQFPGFDYLYRGFAVANRWPSLLLLSDN